jgi:predicted nucleic acid-binding protein
VKLLDTTILVDVLREVEAAHNVVRSMEEAGEPALTTEVNAFELAMGAYRHGRADPRRLTEIENLLERLDVLSLSREGARRGADILAELRAGGRDLGLLDALVAGIALAAGCNVIVTRDEGFRHVPGLRTQSY